MCILSGKLMHAEEVYSIGHRCFWIHHMFMYNLKSIQKYTRKCRDSY